MGCPICSARAAIKQAIVVAAANGWLSQWQSVLILTCWGLRDA
jgi:hypothetical protein